MYLIVGAGLTGSIIANKIANAGHKVVLIEKKQHPGGLHHDYVLNDFLVQENGVHVVKTNDTDLYNYLHNYSSWKTQYDNHMYYCDGEYISKNVNLKDFNILQNHCYTEEEYKTITTKNIPKITEENVNNSEMNIISKKGQYLYNKIFYPILRKQWLRNPITLPYKYGDIVDNDELQYNIIPKKGYTQFITKLLNHPNIQCHYNTSFIQFINDCETKPCDFEKIIYTGKLDDLCDDKLEYVGFENTVSQHYSKYVQQCAVVYHTDFESPLRQIDFNYFHHKNNGTVVLSQNMVPDAEPYFPIETINNINKYVKIKESVSNKYSNMLFVGRLAEYKNMETTEIITNALQFSKFIDNEEDNITLESPKLKSLDQRLRQRALKTLNNDLKRLKCEIIETQFQNKLDAQNYPYKLHHNICLSVLHENNTIVIARYKENIDWIFDLLKSQSWIHKVIIYNKGPPIELNKNIKKVKIVDDQNVGREGKTYLDFIIDNYDELSENKSYTWFLQANPFDHSPDLFNLLHINSVSKYNPYFQTLSCQYIPNFPKNTQKDKRFNINNNKIINYYIDKTTQQCVDCHEFFDNKHDEKVQYLDQYIQNTQHDCYIDYMCKECGINTPKKIIGYSWAALFCVHSALITQHNVNVYKKLRTLLLQHDDQGGYEGFALERFWNYLFTGETYNNTEEIYKELFNVQFSKYVAMCDEDEKKCYILENFNNVFDPQLKPFNVHLSYSMLFVSSENKINYEPHVYFPWYQKYVHSFFKYETINEAKNIFHNFTIHH